MRRGVLCMSFWHIKSKTFTCHARWNRFPCFRASFHVTSILKYRWRTPASHSLGDHTGISPGSVILHSAGLVCTANKFATTLVVPVCLALVPIFNILFFRVQEASHHLSHKSDDSRRCRQMLAKWPAIGINNDQFILKRHFWLVPLLHKSSHGVR